METNLVCVCGVRGYEKEGTAFLHIEDVARGLGFEKAESKNGVEYKSIRWAIVEGYLSDLGFRQEAVENSHDYYIPENIFYRLCMKARNHLAEAFQAKVADEIIPSIRRTGSYISTPRDYLSALKALVASEEAKQKALMERDQAIRTKTLYQEGLASKMSGRVGGLQKANNALRNENSELKDAVGRGCNWRTVSMMKAEWIKEFGHAPSWQKLRQFSEEVSIDPVRDVEERVTFVDGAEKVVVSYRYHKEAWARYRKYEENLRVSQDEVESV